MSRRSTITTFSTTYKLSNIGPLTTIFTPGAPCLTETWLDRGHPALGNPTRTDCYPPGFTTPAQQVNYFSPGMCPASYTQYRPVAPWWLDQGETGAYCCPSGYTMSTNHFLSCMQSITGELRHIWAPAIAVIWKSEDFISTTNSGPATTDTSSPASIVRPNGAPPTSSADSQAEPPRDAQTIVIATVVPVIVIAMFILAFVLYRRRARRVPTDTMNSLPELDGTDKDRPNGALPFWPAPVELSARGVVPPAGVITPSHIWPTPAVEVVELPVHQTDPPASWRSPAAEIATPAPPPVIAAEDDAEIQWLERERERVNERRLRLLQLEELADEDRQLERKIRERRSGASAGL